MSGDYTPQGFIHQLLKDFKLILEQGGKRGQELPLAALNAEVLAACVSRGESERDNAAVIEESRRRKPPSISGRVNSGPLMRAAQSSFPPQRLLSP